jgi:RimJ/RimL family protein N-acetyltransferase
MMSDLHESGVVRLRPVKVEDLPQMFEMQLDPESNVMAGTKPRGREQYFEMWGRNLKEPGIRSRVIEVNGEIVGSMACFQAEGQDCLGYWIARQWWGKGIASRAVKMFLLEERRRPLRATARSNNAASRRILEKCGFEFVEEKMGEETERFLGCEIAVYILKC